MGRSNVYACFTAPFPYQAQEKENKSPHESREVPFFCSCFGHPSYKLIQNIRDNIAHVFSYALGKYEKVEKQGNSSLRGMGYYRHMKTKGSFD